MCVVGGEALGGGTTTGLGAGDGTFGLSRLKGILNREELMRSICGERREIGRRKGKEGGEWRRGGGREARLNTGQDGVEQGKSVPVSPGKPEGIE